MTNDLFVDENKHYVTIWMLSDWANGEEQITEPDRCLKQAWHTFDNLPAPLFGPWKQLLVSDFFEDVKQKCG